MKDTFKGKWGEKTEYMLRKTCRFSESGHRFTLKLSSHSSGKISLVPFKPMHLNTQTTLNHFLNQKKEHQKPKTISS